MSTLPESGPALTLRSDRGLSHRNHEHDPESCRPCGACAPVPVPFELDAVYGVGCDECDGSGCARTAAIEDRFLAGARPVFARVGKAGWEHAHETCIVKAERATWLRALPRRDLPCIVCGNPVGVAL